MTISGAKKVIFEMTNKYIPRNILTQFGNKVSVQKFLNDRLKNNIPDTMKKIYENN